jgi:hypothetical protein
VRERERFTTSCSFVVMAIFKMYKFLALDKSVVSDSLVFSMSFLSMDKQCILHVCLLFSCVYVTVELG